AILPMRAIKNIVLLPINSFMAFVILKFLEQYKQSLK
ncbi:MAG: folate transporter, partial [Lachnospiraceae bacterium]